MLTTIPFSGFYESLHDQDLDWALEQMFTDRETGCHVNQGLQLRAFDSINWQMVHAKYAAEYAKQFSHKFEIPSLKFESLQSPQFYNFTTDRIFCEISEEDVRRLLVEVGDERMTEAAKRRFTSRSGFHSFYNPDWRSWGDVLEWDHNQIGAVLEALADELDELTLMEPARDNGRYDVWLYDCGPKVHRLLKIHDYLQDREERAA